MVSPYNTQRACAPKCVLLGVLDTERGTRHGGDVVGHDGIRVGQIFLFAVWSQSLDNVILVCIVQVSFLELQFSCR